MKNELKFYNNWNIIIPILIELFALSIALSSFFGGNVMESVNFWKEAIAIVVAILGLIAVIVGNIMTTKRDTKNASLQGEETRSAIKEVKVDTSDIKPKINNINENTKETNEIIARKLEPILTTSVSKIDALHKDMERKEWLKSQTSVTLYDKDKFMGGIEKLYEENAKLTNENRDLRIQLVESQSRVKSLEAKNKDLQEENEMLKSTQTPVKSRDSMAQDLSF